MKRSPTLAPAKCSRRPLPPVQGCFTQVCEAQPSVFPRLRTQQVMGPQWQAPTPSDNPACCPLSEPKMSMLIEDL